MSEFPRRDSVSFESLRDVWRPLVRDAGARLSRLLGVGEDAGTRLERIHAPLDATGFRVHQLGWTLLGTACGALAAFALRAPGFVGLVFAPGGGLLAFLIVEQRLSSASARRQRRIFIELPVLSEQLAMLLSSGYSLGSALNRLADRGKGACAQDLRRVTGRVRQGLTEPAALREWADLARVEPLNRVVAILALNSETSDLGRLVSDEARSIRRDVQRDLVTVMERRSQQVWIPVTVATLVPGVIFLIIPFIQALRLFAGS